MTFEAYLLEKKINSEAFKSLEADKWESFRQLFEQMHPNSFTNQKKFLINDLRRKYLLNNEKM